MHAIGLKCTFQHNHLILTHIGSLVGDKLMVTFFYAHVLGHALFIPSFGH